MSDTGEHIVKMTNCVIMWTHSCAPMGQPSHPAPPPSLTMNLPPPP